jgi:hypothetical protein
VRGASGQREQREHKGCREGRGPDPSERATRGAGSAPGVRSPSPGSARGIRFNAPLTHPRYLGMCHDRRNLAPGFEPGNMWQENDLP